MSESKIIGKSKELLSKIPFGVSILRPLYHKFFKQRLIDRQKRVFQQNALSVISDFHDCMEDCGHFYTLAFGTMLGAVREKGFIKHDFDIDVYMWSEDYSQEIQKDLEEKGFRLVQSFVVDNGLSGREETYEKDGVGIDIFYVYPAVDQLPYCCDFLTTPDCITFEIEMKKYGGVVCRRLEMPFERERDLTDFENIRLYIPKNAQKLLAFRYGPNYMIPNPNWTVSGYDNHFVVWKEKKGIYKQFN